MTKTKTNHGWLKWNGHFYLKMYSLLTSPGLIVPMAGDMVNGALSGTTKWKEVGPTGKMSPLPTLGTGCVNWLLLMWSLTTKRSDVDVSPIAVALNRIRVCESFRGGRTPTARQRKVNSRPMWDLQTKLKRYSYNKLYKKSIKLLKIPSLKLQVYLFATLTVFNFVK